VSLMLMLALLLPLASPQGARLRSVRPPLAPWVVTYDVHRAPYAVHGLL
jgi:hypothetical protein